jgi:subtilase family serine protease
MVSTGDNGAAGCDNPGTPAQFGLNVNGLASTPFNVAVGGTDFAQFTTDPTTYWNQTNAPITQQSVKGYIPETTWNDSCANPLFQFIQGGTTNAETNCNNPSFSGFLDSAGGSGGKSLAWLKPSWQTGTPADSARDLPDISLFSSDGFLGSFYVICVKHLTGGVCDLNSFAGFGGTSVASPAFAGIMALVNQVGCAGQSEFYPLQVAAKQANAFHDVSGTTIAIPCFREHGYDSKPGSQFGVLAGFTCYGHDLAHWFGIGGRREHGRCLE